MRIRSHVLQAVTTGMAALLIGAVLSTSVSPATEDDTFVVIVATANPATSIKRQELARFFLKKTGRWSDGVGVLPVDQSAHSPVRGVFTRIVLSVEGMGQISAVESFWLQQVYSGRSTPPPVRDTDAGILAFVAANPGAIGYVGAAPTAGAVKVLKVTN
jgi:ABC-type phosphate transport system substrate-binding protein